MEPNYFELFDLPVHFNIDKSALKKQFIILSRDLHPDFHTQASEKEMEEITEKYALVNKVFKTLSDDFNRRQYILEFHGILKGNEEKLSAEFLMEMMELNEEIETMLMDGDPNASSKAESLIVKYEIDLQNELVYLEKLFDSNPVMDMDILTKIKDCHLKTKYLLRIREKVANIAAL